MLSAAYAMCLPADTSAAAIPLSSRLSVSSAALKRSASKGDLVETDGSAKKRDLAFSKNCQVIEKTVSIGLFLEGEIT